MSEIYTQATNVARNAVSAVLCAAGGLSRLGQDIAGKVNPFYDGSLLDDYQTGVTNALNRFCPVPRPGGPVAPTQPFLGGQCTAVSYRVTGQSEATRDDGSTGPIDFGSFLISDVRGPITYIGQSPTSKSSGILIGKNFQGQSQTFSLGGTSDTRYTFRLKSYSITRNDGQPDNCGDPPPVFPPGTPTPTDPEPPGTVINIDLPDVGPTNITFTPVVGIVYVNNEGDFIVPVTVNVAEPTINLNFDIDLGVNISRPDEPTEPIDPSPPKNPDGRPEPRDCPPPRDCNDEPEPEPPSPEPPEEDRKNYRIVGVVVLSAVDRTYVPATEILQSAGPNIWAPRLGYIRFVYQLTEEDKTYSEDIPVKLISHYIEVPQKDLRCIQVIGNPERGVSFELIPVTRKITSNSCR